MKPTNILNYCTAPPCMFISKKDKAFNFFFMVVKWFFFGSLLFCLFFSDDILSLLNIKLMTLCLLGNWDGRRKEQYRIVEPKLTLGITLMQFSQAFDCLIILPFIGVNNMFYIFIFKNLGNYQIARGNYRYLLHLIDMKKNVFKSLFFLLPTLQKKKKKHGLDQKDDRKIINSNKTRTLRQSFEALYSTF